MNPLVTVIIPAFNHSQYVGETIQSVFAQTYTNWEIIFIDDCSPDDTFVVATSLLEQDTRATLIKKDSNKGLVDSLNLGIFQAQGQYIAFLASDDAWESNFLKISVEAAFDHPNAVIFSNTIVGAKNYFQQTGVIQAKEMRKVLLRTNPVVSVGCLYPARFLMNLLDIDTSIYLEDYYIRWKTVFAGLDHYATGQAMVRYRQPLNSMSRNYSKIIKGRFYLFRVISKEMLWKERFLFLLELTIKVLKEMISHISTFAIKRWG